MALGSAAIEIEQRGRCRDAVHWRSRESQETDGKAQWGASRETRTSILWLSNSAAMRFDNIVESAIVARNRHAQSQVASEMEAAHVRWRAAHRQAHSLEGKITLPAGLNEQASRPVATLQRR